MQEFRPANVIEQDTELAERLIDGELQALDELCERYARPVAAIVAARSGSQPTAVDVFARAWISRGELTPGDDFSTWIGAIAADGRRDADLDDADLDDADLGDADLDDADRLWVVAAAVGAIDPDSLDALRGYHLDGEELAEGLDRHELRLRRRLAQLGDDDAIAAALRDPTVWTPPPERLVADVRAAIGSPSSLASLASTLDSADTGSLLTDGDAPDGSDGDVGGEQARPGRVSRSLRPLVFGLAGAVVVLFVAIVALSAASGSPDPVAFSADFTPTGVVPDVEGGDLTATVRDSGVEFALDAPTLPRRSGDRYYEGLLVLDDGSQLSVGTFSQGFAVTLWGGVSLDRIDEFRVVAREIGSDVDDVVLKLDIPRD